MHERDFAGVSSRRFGEQSRWLISKSGGRWHVRPPVGSFWGRSSSHDNHDDALAAYRRETSHIRG